MCIIESKHCIYQFIGLNGGCLCAKSLSRVRLFVTPWAVAHQGPLSMGFSRQEYWSGLPFPSPGDLPHPGIEPRSPALQANSLPSELPGKPNLSFCGWLFPFSVLSSGFIHVVALVDFCLLLSLNGAYTLCVFCTMSKILFQP